MWLSSLRKERQGTEQTQEQKTQVCCSPGRPKRVARQIPAQCYGDWDRDLSVTDGDLFRFVLYPKPAIACFHTGLSLSITSSLLSLRLSIILEPWLSCA